MFFVKISSLVLICGLIHSSQPFYLSGLAPQNYCKKFESSESCKSEVILYVNRLDTEESVLPYEYSHFDFCTTNESKSSVENLDQVNFGEYIRPSPYKINFMENTTCQVLCKKQYVGGQADSEQRLRRMKKGMSLDYQHHWIIDNMPVRWCYPLQYDRQYCSTGFSMGCLVRNSKNPDFEESCALNPAYNHPGTYYLFNHVDLLITYNLGRIISVQVTPSSIRHDVNAPDCNSQQPLEIPVAPLEQGKTVDVLYTYSVKFVHIVL